MLDYFLKRILKEHYSRHENRGQHVPFQNQDTTKRHKTMIHCISLLGDRITEVRSITKLKKDKVLRYQITKYFQFYNVSQRRISHSK